MPRFLETKLRREAAAKGLTGRRADRYTYGAMNNEGLMHGNQETAKGRAVERTHEADHPARNLGAHLHPPKRRSQNKGYGF